MKKNIFVAALAVFLGVIFIYAATIAAPTGTVVEKDPGPTIDAPDSPNLSQDAPVLQRSNLKKFLAGRQQEMIW